MANIKVTNTHTAPIILHLKAEKGGNVTKIVVPPMKRKNNKPVYGTAMVDADLLEKARKLNAGVEAYFEHRVLTLDRIELTDKPEAGKPEPKK